MYTVGNVIEICWLEESPSPASHYWNMREKRRGRVSSNARFQAALFRQCSANLPGRGRKEESGAKDPEAEAQAGTPSDTWVCVCV